MSELARLPAPDLARAADYARAALAAYAADWADFAAWCRDRGVAALPAAPPTVAAYLAALASTHAGATLRRRLAAIGRAHRMAGHPWPATHLAIRDTLAGILRQHGTPACRAAALGIAEIRRFVATCSDGAHRDPRPRPAAAGLCRGPAAERTGRGAA